jgi:hypothetical protein
MDVASKTCNPWLRLNCLNPNLQAHQTLASETRLTTECGRFTIPSIVGEGEIEPSSRPHREPQGDEWGTYRLLYAQLERTTGSSKGREPYDDRALIVVRGRESRLHGEGGQTFTRPRTRGRGA